jgi:peptide/nickel transport system permease protein
VAQTPITGALPGAQEISVAERRGGRQPLRRAGRFARRRKLGAFGMVLALLVLAIAILSPALQRYNETRQFSIPNPDFNPTANPIQIAQNQKLSSPTINSRYESPGGAHWFGTDQYGRDIYARIIVGARIAIIIGIGASLIAVVTGTAIGLISGYFGGTFDLIVQRFVDALQAFPSLILLLLIVQVVKEPPLWLTVVALGILGWATAVRVVRSTVLAVSRQPFVEAARCYGAGDLRIMLQHVLPNVTAPIIIIFSIGIGAYILAEAGLSFLGLGPSNTTTWGKMVSTGRVALDLHPWEALFAGTAITLTVLGFNLAGDALRDELDPRLRGG